MNPLIAALLSAIVSGTVVGAIVGALLKYRFDALAARAGLQRSWKERAVAELLGPVYMQLARTERAFRRWDERNLFLEAKVIREGNVTIRDLLLAKPHLIPPDLLPAADELIEHYDRWLEEFDRVRSAESPELDSAFVFVGPKGYLFPRPAADAFQQAYLHLWRELYPGAVQRGVATDAAAHGPSAGRAPSRPLRG